MSADRTDMMGRFNDQLDDLRSNLYTLLEFDADDWSEKKSLARREVLYAINELRISVENL